MNGYRFLATHDCDGTAIVTIDRPEARNAMTPESWRELRHFIEEAGGRDGVRCIVITGAGDRSFVSGADIASLNTRTSADTLDASPQAATGAIEQCPKPVIAAINGYAFGGGFELALACDLRIVCERTRLGLPEPGLGIIPGIGGTQRLARCVGLGVAKEIILAGRTIDGEEAVRLGLALRCVPQPELLASALELAASMQTRGPLALTMAKRLLNAALSTNQESGLLMEKLALCLLMDTKDKKEGTSAFLEKRKPSFSGR